MDCVNHNGVSATAYCQNCGKALCAGCVRTASGGQVLCESCWRSWQSYQQPFIAPLASGPNPGAAAALGLIPGVGAMYNGQFVKGFIHVAVFAVLVSGASEFHSPIDTIFGLFIPAWIIYQSFEAFHTAKALRDGLPLPDPFGLNELGGRLNMGTRTRNPNQSGAEQGPVDSASYNPGAAGQGTESYPPPYAEQYQSPYQAPFTPPTAGFTDPAAPQPPVPVCWRRSEPVGAIVLIALGVLFLLQQLDIFHGRLLDFTWPMVLIALGVWLIVRRLGDSQGGPK
jgi:TM2 domain-containing membrane protein YozV